MRYIQEDLVMKRMNKRLNSNKMWKIIFIIATSFALVSLGMLLYRILSQGIGF